MIKSTISFLYILAASIVSYSTSYKDDESENKNLKQEITEYILHHVKDSHDFGLLSYKDKKTNRKVYVGVPLPIIIYDKGFKFFMSSKFDHGRKVAEIGGSHYALFHNKIYKTDSKGTINYDKDGHPLNSKPLDFSITKSVVSIIFVSILMFFLFRNLAQSYNKNGLISSGVGRFFEPLIIYIRDEIAIPNIGVKHHKRFMSFLLTIFFFVWFCNILGLTPLGVNVTGNIAITFCLALLTFIITTISGTKDYWMHIFWMPGMPLPMKIIMAPIELLGVFIKPFTLMIRLYANILAGHIVMMTLISMIFLFRNFIGSGLSFLLAFFISIIEILVALLQAYIFTILSALYFGFAVEEHDH